MAIRPFSLMVFALMLGGCYAHRPIPFESAATGEMVRLRFTEDGVTQFAQTFGVRQAHLMGEVLQGGRDHLLLSVRMSVPAGGAQYGRGYREFRVSPEHVSLVEIRELDQRRTTALVVGGGLALALSVYLITVIDPGGARVIRSPDGDFWRGLPPHY
jgi:hypothetical protein